ncbi:hypothetical protein PI126_g15403 [Phytophthora idaei]|nr:hypothetical protein PI126_g15403 [Phytophthora idaei]
MSSFPFDAVFVFFVELPLSEVLSLKSSLDPEVSEALPLESRSSKSLLNKSSRSLPDALSLESRSSKSLLNESSRSLPDALSLESRSENKSPNSLPDALSLDSEPLMSLPDPLDPDVDFDFFDFFFLLNLTIFRASVSVEESSLPESLSLTESNKSSNPLSSSLDPEADKTGCFFFVIGAFVAFMALVDFVAARDELPLLPEPSSSS